MAAVTDDLHLMANLSPLFTGLPFVVWISERGIVRGNASRDISTDIRMKISKGKKAHPSEMIQVALSYDRVALRLEIRVVGGKGNLSIRELQLLEKWGNRNWPTLVAYWQGEIFTEQAIRSLRAVK